MDWHRIVDAACDAHFRQRLDDLISSVNTDGIDMVDVFCISRRRRAASLSLCR